MTTSLSADQVRNLSSQLQQSNNEFASKFPGESGRRQPVHTVYGGAHLFRSDTKDRLGSLALQSLDRFASDWMTFAKAIGLAGGESLPESGSIGATDLISALERD